MALLVFFVPFRCVDSLEIPIFAAVGKLRLTLIFNNKQAK